MMLVVQPPANPVGVADFFYLAASLFRRGSLIEYDQDEPCWNCGYPIGLHSIGGPCLDELAAMRVWGLL